MACAFTTHRRQYDDDNSSGAEVMPSAVMWFDLSTEQRTAAQELGYNRQSWDNCERTEATDEYFHQLTDEQKEAASVRQPSPPATNH